MKYLAYFQAYTNTYEKIEILKRLYEEALAVENVVGLVIGTRPDCVSEDLLGYLSELGRHTFVLLEYGVETTDDALLERIIVRLRLYVLPLGMVCMLELI